MYVLLGRGSAVGIPTLPPPLPTMKIFTMAYFHALISFQDLPGSYDGGGGGRSHRNNSKEDDKSKFGTVRKPFSRYVWQLKLSTMLEHDS